MSEQPEVGCKRFFVFWLGDSKVPCLFVGTVTKVWRSGIHVECEQLPVRIKGELWNRTVAGAVTDAAKNIIECAYGPTYIHPGRYVDVWDACRCLSQLQRLRAKLRKHGLWRR